MLIQSNAVQARADISSALMDLRFRGDADESVALDIIEAICRRIRTPQAYQVAAVGFFVRANIRLHGHQHVSFATLVDRFTRAVLQAPLGNDQLVDAFVVSQEH